MLSFERPRAYTREGLERCEDLRRELATREIDWHWLRYHKTPTLPAIKFGAGWLLVTLLLWMSLLAARGAGATWRNRACYPGSIFENVARMLVLVPLIAMLDAATFIGTLQWVLKDRSRLSHAAGV